MTTEGRSFLVVNLKDIVPEELILRSKGKCMASEVFYTSVSQTDGTEIIQEQLHKLLLASQLLDGVNCDERVVLKIHFGEEGNKGFVKPEYTRVIIDKVKERGGVPILSDTNTLYRGRRTNSKDHLELAAEHGFTEEGTGAKIFIPENAEENNVMLPSEHKFIKNAKVAKVYIEADHLINISHFKGHIMTGFGGALKNIGMGCAAREGKLEQHSGMAPLVDHENCVGCEACYEACPAEAITISDKKSYINEERCIGCASCIAACEYSAIDVDWNSGENTIQEKMVEYAKAVLDKKSGQVVHINFAIKITKECDCLAQDDPRICPDIGILMSTDPVSVDKACYDLVVQRCGQDIFKKVHPERDGMKQLLYSASLGVGALEYRLIEV
ncbi:MAG: DUF362 domain-containing protein [Candidatus Omnitrophica bacterium]|nr:DUF362 domain-containing protein [Candidatus Omnitrophota bacterium]